MTTVMRVRGAAATALFLMMAALVARPASAACDPDGLQSSGAVYRICMPPAGYWNGDLVIWAHGYQAFNEPLVIPEDQLQLPDGTSLPGLINALGYAFATTSYSTNGLAIKEGLADVVDLVGVFTGAKGTPDKVYLVGASEGGLVTALAVERHPDVFDGGIAACGPIGNFQAQVNYLGDGRVLFDALLPGFIEGSAAEIPADVIADWTTHYETVIKPALFAPANILKTLQLVQTAKLAYDPADFWGSVEHSVRDVLWYNVFATNDATAKLGGTPYDNLTRNYTGSLDDAALNAAVERIGASPAAVAEMYAHYETTGLLTRPLVTLHTLADQQVPWGHQLVHYIKALLTGSASQLVVIPVNRYGHCNFTPAEVLVSFVALVYKAEGTPLAGAEAALKSPAAQAEFRALATAQGLKR